MLYSAVVQGAIYPYTNQVIEEIQLSGIFDTIVVSCRESDQFNVAGILTVKYPAPELPGVGNRNHQIMSTRHGLSYIDPDTTVVKLRTDQIYPASSFRQMKEFYDRNKQPHRIMVAGGYSTFPFHPRDHLFWGDYHNLSLLFSVPLDTCTEVDYCKNTRAETYLGAWYIGQFEPSVLEYWKSPQTYLTDSAPKREEAMASSTILSDHYFLPCQKVSMSWPKYGLTEYYYNYVAGHGQYWSP